MKKKIIITGGLGYIGTELCKLYSGVSWHHDITIIDNRFISERVNQIRNWNMEFIQGDILDKNLIQKYFKDADIVHHLAGVTDVPRTKTESSTSQDERIKEVGEKGTQNILDVISDKCKIIFPSTHVVFEGLNEVRNPSQYFLEEQLKKSYGRSLTCILEGTRPIIVETQALVTNNKFGNGRRTTQGVDSNRLSMLIAVIEKYFNLSSLNIGLPFSEI